MKNTHNKKYWLIAGGILALALCWIGFSMMKDSSTIAVDAAKPALLFQYAQKITATPDEGAFIRSVDDTGVVMTLDIPPGAVREVTELTVTPIVSSKKGLQHGLSITPSNIEFIEPVTLSYNWYFANQLQNSRVTADSMVAMQFQRTNQTVRVVPRLYSIASEDYLPVRIDTAGWYGVSNDSVLQGVASERTLNVADNIPATLEAGLVLFGLNDIRSSEEKIVQAKMDAVLNQSEPDLHELALASKLNTIFENQLSVIPKAHAYGSFDKYLQFRCNHPDTDYEDAMMAMDIALNMGYSSVVDTCIERAKKILLIEARKIDNDPSRPFIDTREVLIQMQLLGLDTAGGEATEIANRLTEDIVATVDAKLAAFGQDPDATLTGRIRPDGSLKPLQDGETTLILELLGVEMSNFVGIKAWDKDSLNEFADQMHDDMSILLDMSDEMCDWALNDPTALAVRDDLDFLNEEDIKKMEEECKKVQSGNAQNGLDQWEEEMGEYADGVDNIQKGKKPQDGWDDFSEADAYFE